MSVAAMMTMRAILEQNEGAKNGYGGKTEDWQIISPAEPCAIFVRSKSVPVDGGTLKPVEHIVGLFRRSSKVKIGNRIREVTDRRSRQLFEGTLFVDVVVTKVEGGKVSHLEAVLRRHSDAS